MERNEQSDHDVARSIGGVIFAGGRSSRMSMDKALMSLAGKPLLVRSMSGVQPVVGLWSVAMAPDLRDALGQGVRKVGAWAKARSAIKVAFPQTDIGGKMIDPFININQPEDLAAAEALRTRRAV